MNTYCPLSQCTIFRSNAVHVDLNSILSGLSQMSYSTFSPGPKIVGALGSSPRSVKFESSRDPQRVQIDTKCGYKMSSISRYLL